jgi:hypothetical protein
MRGGAISNPGFATLSGRSRGVCCGTDQFNDAIAKLVLAGEQAGFTVEQMIQILQTGSSIEILFKHDRMAASFALETCPHALWPHTAVASSTRLLTPTLS